MKKAEDGVVTLSAPSLMKTIVFAVQAMLAATFHASKASMRWYLI